MTARKVCDMPHVDMIVIDSDTTRYGGSFFRRERTCRILQAYGDESEELDHRMEEIAGTPEDTVACICQSCGHEFRYDRMVHPRFCPNCGARAVD